eukprot:29098-Pelagococcus_subviridis.AAC.8
MGRTPRAPRVEETEGRAEKRDYRRASEDVIASRNERANADAPRTAASMPDSGHPTCRQCPTPLTVIYERTSGWS